MDALEFQIKFNLWREAAEPCPIPRQAALALNVPIEKVAAIIKMQNERVYAAAKELRHALPVVSPTSPQRIVFLGDSITNDREGYVEMIRELLQDETQVTIINSGVSGNRSSDALLQYKARVSDYAPTQLWILLGVNDRRAIKCGNRIRSITSLGEYLDNLCLMIEEAQLRAIHTTVISLPPDCTDKDKGDATTGSFFDCAIAKSFDQGLKKLCSDLNVQFLDMAPIYEPYAPAALTIDDGVHLNRVAHALLAKECVKSIFDCQIYENSVEILC